MRSWIIAACIAGQLAVLGYMVYGREMIIHRGTKVSIATAPIDPRDPFRGDFVRLRFPLNTLSYAPVRWQPADYQPRKGDKMYAVLEPRPGGLHDVAYFSNLPPAAETESLYLRGRIQSAVHWNDRNLVDVRYGIEQLFVEQGSGVDIEERRGIRGGMQNAMHARIAIGTDGSAVLTGYTWSDIAIGLEVTEAFQLTEATTSDDAESADNNGNVRPGEELQSSAPDAEPATPTVPPLRVTITNVSRYDLTLNNPGDNCGFTLEPVKRSNSAFFKPKGVCTDLSIAPVTLAAGESMILDIDLADPRWHMSRKLNDLIQTADIRTFPDSREWFRVVYRSEQQVNAVLVNNVDNNKAEETTLDDNASAVRFWQGDLVSQSFSQWGQLD